MVPLFQSFLSELLQAGPKITLVESCFMPGAHTVAVALATWCPLLIR